MDEQNEISSNYEVSAVAPVYMDETPAVENQENAQQEQFVPPQNFEQETVFVDSNVAQAPQEIPAIVPPQANIEHPLLEPKTEDQVPQMPPMRHDSQYDIYSLSKPETNPSLWPTTPNDPCEFVRFWASSDSFQNYQTNSKELRSFNSIFYAIGFAAVLLTCFVLMCCTVSYSALVSINYDTNKIPLAIFLSFLIVLVYLAVLVLNQVFLPSVFIDFGFITALIFHVLCVFFFMFFKVFYWIGPWICIFCVAAFLYFGARGKEVFNKKIFEILNNFVFKRMHMIIFLLTALTFVSVFAVFAMYTSWGATGLFWNNFVQFFFVLTFWYCINVFGNCFYMISASLMAHQYFISSSSSFSDVLHATLRSFVFNIGVASRAALVLPITEWLHCLATCDSTTIGTDLLDSLPGIIGFVRKIASLLHEFGLLLSNFFDKLFGYPSRRALAYCAMYGIDWNDACMRYAEVTSKRRANILDLAYTGDTIWLFRSFNAEIVLCMIVFVLGPELHGTGIAAGRGFFLAFALFYTTRSILRGAAETLFVCFGEDPDRADNVAADLKQELSDAFATASRNMQGVMNTTALLENGSFNNPYQQ